MSVPDMPPEQAPPRLLGVLGGMGPAATTDFCGRLTTLRKVERDQDHVPCIVVNDPRVPDRSAAIVNGDEAAVVAALTAGLRRLEAAGVEGVAVPCNTAHRWVPQLRRASTLDWIEIQDAVAVELRASVPPGARVAVLATRGTLESDIYGPVLAADGYHSIPLPADENAAVWRAIEAVKAGRFADARFEMTWALARISERADVAILACTELPLAVASDSAPIRLLDSTGALARACIAWSFSDEKACQVRSSSTG